MTAEELQIQQAALAVLQRQSDALDQSLAVLDANLTIELDKAATLIVRLKELHKQVRDAIHRQDSLATGLINTHDYLNKTDPQ